MGRLIGLLIVSILAHAALNGAAFKKEEISVEALLYDLRSPSAERRKEAARLLGNERVQSAVPALVEAAKDQDDEVRKEVAIALNKIRDERALPAFISLLDDRVKDTRRMALAGIVNLHLIRETGFIATAKRLIDFLNPFSSADDDLVIEPYVQVDPQAIDAIKRRLRDPEVDIRMGAAKALGILRARAAVPEMLEALRLEREDDVRVALIRAFYKIEDRSVGPELIRLINDPVKKVHDEAILTLGLLRVKEAVPELMRLYESGIQERKTILKVIPASASDDLQLKCLQALAYIGDKSTEDLFVKALRHPNDNFREAAAEGLARIANPVLAVVVSRERLKEKDDNVKLAESFALYRMGRKEYLDEIIDALGKLRLHSQAEAYLSEFRGEEVKDLYPHLRSKNAKIRARLCEVLGLVGDAETIKHLEPLMRDKNVEVAAAANQAVRRINGRLQRRSQ